MQPLQQTSWQPKNSGIAALGFAGFLMAIFCVTPVTDAPGRVLAGFAAVGLLAYSAMSAHARPKLAITDRGLVMKGPFTTRDIPRSDIASVRITEFRRIGRKVRLLEIDTTDQRLHVFTRWDLGVEPLAVLDALTAAGYAGRQA
jgi:hypothetical protein